jgi:Carboxypeptidase regulatory-like domain
MRISLAIKSLTGLSAMVVATAMTVPAQAYEEGTVSGGGSITGKVAFNGTPGTRKVIPTKDLEVCGGPYEQTLIQVGPDKSVQNAVVYLVDIAKGKAWPAQAKTPEVDNVKCKFEPNIQVIRAGKLDVVNSDPMLHNTHGYYGRRTAFNLALPNQGQRIPVDLPRPGEVRIDCDAHGWMEGWIYVVDNPYYAVTGADGKFSISNVPAGNYKLVAVHPFTGPNEQSVTVAAGKPTDLNIELEKGASSMRGGSGAR